MCKLENANGRGVPLPGTCEYFRRMSHSIFGEERLTAVLSGIAHSTRSKYVIRWKHWGSFAKERGLGHWVARNFPDCGDVLIDFILFETRMMGNSVDFDKGEIS